MGASLGSEINLKNGVCLKEILYICTVKWKYELKTFKTNFRMRRILLFTVLVYLTTALFAGDKKQLPKHTFAVDKLCGYTSVLNQAKTSTCWAHATASLLESDRLFAGGDTVRLSVMYIARQKYLEHFNYHYYTRGRDRVRGGSLGHTSLRMIARHGILPTESYTGLTEGVTEHNHRELIKQLATWADLAVKERNLPLYREKAEALLDSLLGEVPQTFHYKGKSYTPQSFAAYLQLEPDSYVELTSFSHHPYYTSFILEVPDNWEHASFYNLPLDELERTVREALAKGQTVLWDGDMSEETFCPKQGMAIWEECPVTQESRQRGFEQFTTTDDHLMHIVGTAHDETGKFYYIIKDSFGDVGPYHGLIYMSEDYFRAKTVSVMLKK